MEIKFRVWDYFNECFWFSDRYSKLSTFFNVIDNLKSGGNKMSKLQQFSGRKSKNGKDIYEGDILWTYPFEEYKNGYGGSVKNGNYVITKYEMPEGENEDEIMNQIKLIGFHTTNGTINDERYDDWENLYLIGNIYENPDLIEK
jgi:uncharacterized phage protein (TIGR01671 family)